LQPFAEFAKFLEDLKTRTVSFANGFFYVNRLAGILERYKIRIPSKHLVLIDDLKNDLDNFHLAQKEGLNFFEREINSMNDILNSEMISLDSELHIILEDLTVVIPQSRLCLQIGQFINPEANPQNILVELFVIKARLDNHALQAATFSNWKKVFKKKPYEFEYLEAALIK
jgi:hypothetical protein